MNGYVNGTKCMDAIILLAHGSRMPDASKDMDRIAAGLRSRYRRSMIEVCNMSQTEPLFPETFAKCAQQGATRVIVIPYFLHFGVHLRQDIPALLREEARKAPQVTVVLGKHLGFDEALVDLVEKRICESVMLGDGM
ncbi:MAG: CbiX/SirB N-terminal domain-containing protein [Planctomycetota bacterium]